MLKLLYSSQTQVTWSGYQATIKQLWAQKILENISNFQRWALSLVDYK